MRLWSQGTTKIILPAVNVHTHHIDKVPCTCMYMRTYLSRIPVGTYVFFVNWLENKCHINLTVRSMVLTNFLGRYSRNVFGKVPAEGHASVQ